MQHRRRSGRREERARRREAAVRMESSKRHIHTLNRNTAVMEAGMAHRARDRLLRLHLGLWHVAHYGQYAMILATLCGLLVYKVGIFEGSLIAMAIHGLVNYPVFKQAGKIPSKVIVKKYFEKFSANANGGAD